MRDDAAITGGRRSGGPRIGVRTAVRSTAALTAVAVLAACGGGGGGVPDDVRGDVAFVGVAAEATRDDAMAAASVRLAARLLDLGEEGTDVVVSPASLQLALALLREGASGRAAEAIDAVAGLGGSEAVAHLRAALAAHDGDLDDLDRDEPPPTPLLHVADAAFVQEGVEPAPGFLERIARYHDAGAHAVDFGGGTAGPVLDAWVAKETGGLLTKSPLTPTPDTLLVLMNAVTFGARWATPFPGEGTWDGAFLRADGTEVQVPLMRGSARVPYVEGHGWYAVELPYTDGFAMRLVLRDGGWPTADTWADAHARLDAAGRVELEVVLPRWETDTTLDLLPALEDLGLGSLLTPGDLDGVLPDAFVGGMAQGATITVAEKGTVAAAVTSVAIAGAAPGDVVVEVRFDRPFEYQVVHEDTGLVLFAGRVADPS